LLAKTGIHGGVDENAGLKLLYEQSEL
jgi:hypothetical protein